jgi:uncharacterized damage-inducible protein DinB
MIEAGYVRTMARYNAWQNRQLTQLLTGVNDDVLRADRGAFFGSIMETLNHLLWGDTIWMSRFDPRIAKPEMTDHRNFTPTFAVWTAERFQMDGAIRSWASSLRTIDLKENLDWYSGILKQNVRQPLDQCIVHMFNHQTHHRGQVHAMMTAAGLKAPVSDIVFMPEDT